MERCGQDNWHALVSAGFVAAILIYVYPLLLSTPLLEPDEGLHATISQEMVERGDWIVPTFRGEPFLDKPILYFWAQMASLKLFGMNEAAVRLPGLMFGLLGGLTTGLLAHCLFGNRVGPVAGLMAMTMLIPLSLAQAAAHDVALVPWTNLTLLCLWEMQRSGSRQRRTRWMAGAVTGFALAILTKALIGVALIVIGYCLYLLANRRIQWKKFVDGGIALVFGMLLASPWFVAMEFRVNGYLYYYFVQRHVLGFATATQQHGHEPWYYYLPFLTGGALPWIWYIVPLLRDEWNVRRTRPSLPSAPVILLLCWLAGGVLFLSVAKSKLVTYSLPLFPAIATLCAVAWCRFVTKQLSDSSRAWFVVTTRFSGVLGIVTPVIGLLCCQWLLNTTWPVTCWLVAVGVAAMSLLSWYAFERQQYYQSLALCCVCVSGLAALIMTWPLSMFAEEHSERSLAEWVNQQGVHPPRLILVGEKPASLIFYLNRQARDNLPPNRFTHQDFAHIRYRERLQDGAVLAVTRKTLREEAAETWAVPGASRESVGQFEVFLSNGSFMSLVEMAGRSIQ